MNSTTDITKVLEQAGIIGIEKNLDPILPDPDLLNYYKNLSRREIWLDNDVTEETLEISKIILNFNKEDEEAGIPVADRKPIKLLIHSYGGDAATCLNLIGTILLSKTPVYTYNMGVAMSAAAYILIAGHKRFATSLSTVLIHSGSGGAQGTFEQTESQMKDYKHTIEVIREFTCSHTKIDKKKFDKHKNTEWYIYPQEQLKLGIIDKIITSVDEM